MVAEARVVMGRWMSFVRMDGQAGSRHSYRVTYHSLRHERPKANFRKPLAARAAAQRVAYCVKATSV